MSSCCAIAVPSISVWNLGEDSSYMIGLHAADRTLPRGDLITDFAYNPLKASLYASTVSGNVVMWRLVGTQVRVCRLIVVEPCVCVGGG